MLANKKQLLGPRLLSLKVLDELGLSNAHKGLTMQLRMRRLFVGPLIDVKVS